MGIMVGIACCVGNKRAVATAESEPTGIMTFADPAMQALCAKTWGDGTNITYEQAREVTEIPKNWARDNKTITSFNEIKYFKNLLYIRERAFTNCSNLVINEISLPNVLLIELSAFANCTSLGCELLNLPSCETLGTTVFYNTTIKKVVMPKLKTIADSYKDYGCFQQIPNLESVTLRDIEYIGDYSFKNATKLVLDSIEYNNLKRIGISAFENCKFTLNKAILPKCTKIETTAFYGCKSMTLTTLELPLCTTIGNQAFYGCTSIAIEDLSLPNLTSLGLNAFYGAKIKKISNLGSITTLPGTSGTNGTLGDKSTLEEVVLPETLTTIGQNSIYGYTNLTSIGSGVFPNVTTIGYNCFYNIPNVAQAVSFPALTSVSSTSSNSNHDAFTKCGFTEFHAPLLDLANTSVYQNGYGLFLGCTNLRILEIGKLTVVPLGFVSGCTSLENVSDLSKVTYVSKTAFRNTPSLRIHLKLPVCTKVLAGTANGLEGTFSKSGILSLDAPMLLEIGKDIYSWNSTGAFQECANLTLVKLRDVTTIGMNSFYKCPNLSKVIIDNETPPTLGGNAFASCSSELAFYVPDESVEAYKTATNWSAYANKILPLSQFNG